MYRCENWTIKKQSTEELMLSISGAGEDSWESLGQQGDQISQSQRKLTLNIHWMDIHPSNPLDPLDDAEAEAPILSPPDAKDQLIRKDLDVGEDWSQEEKGMTENEMVGWHHWLCGHEFEQTPGDGEGQWSLVCWSPWCTKESDMTEWLNSNHSLWAIMEATHVVLWLECLSSQSFPLVSLKGVMGCTTLSLQKWTQCLLALTYRAYHNLPLFEVLD